MYDLSCGRILVYFVEAEKADEYLGVREGQKQLLSEALAGSTLGSQSCDH